MATIQVNGPGKTAPKLLADFLQFDPQKNVGGNFNILTSHPPPVGEGQVPTPHRDACKHEYTVKVNQSVTPPLDSRPDASTQYKLAVVCKRCRLHTDIRISYQQATDPCPTSESQLHHFQRALGLDNVGAAHITYGWQCSSATCQALLTTTFKMGRFSNADRNLLTDTSKLKSRFEAVMQQDPTREGIRQATPVEALTRLRKYIRDALNTEHDKRVFPANNKRFMEAYGVHGQDCRELLERLGFEYNSKEQEFNWTLPNPPPIQDRLNSTGDSLREHLEDVELELLALAWRTAAEMNVVNPAAGEGWSSAHRDLERILGAQGYQRTNSLRRTNVANELEQYFASLGAISDFSDSLVDFAYERQTRCDVLSEPYYYECIQSIAKQRGSEELQVKTTMLESKGLVSRRDLSDAYRFFNLNSDSRSVDDDRIFNLFQAQHADSGVHGQERAREMLGRIGRSRGSKMLINASQQKIETVEEAYAWIGNNLGPDADDSFVVTMFSVRTDGNKELEEIGRKAVSIIARERNSSFLKSWLEGDDPNQTTMKIDEALPLLGVDTALDQIDATLWPEIFSSVRSDKPGVQTERAIAAVQKALAGPSTGANTMHAPETWPVGLVSHGNTCYLNSLLQYYFSLKPLREIVTDYDQYKMDISKSQEKLERVGQRRVSTQEILGGKKFADELRHLFGRMVKDRGPAVKPEQDLVCRAFLDPRDFAELEAQKCGNDSAIDDTTMPDLASTNNDEEAKEPRSRASSATLQADDQNADSQTGDVQMNGIDPPLSAPNQAPLSPPDSAPTSPGQKPVDQQADGPAPPPLPPRRFSTTTSDTLRQAEAKATQQQDVTEVHDSITQRLRAGMQPKGADNRGEQVDALRDLFAIGMSQTAVSGTTVSKPELISDSSIQLNVPTEPSDLYSALDDYFDLQVVTEGSEKQQYRSILELPPLVQINMPRIGFNKETKEAYKSDAPLRLEDELYLDRYCEGTASNVLERRRSAWGWRKNLLELKKEQKALQGTGVGLEGPAAVSETARFLKSLKDVNEELIAAGEDPIDGDLDVHVALEEDAIFQKERLESLDLQVSTLQGKLTGTFDDLKEKKYRLYAVFFHRGGSSSGHYWVSIHDFPNNIWRSYNDESVTEVQSRDLDNIFYAKEWQHGTPTFAVYVRDDLKDNYVQAVCRAPEEAPPATDPSGDVTMTENSQWNNSSADNINPQALVKEGGNGSSWDLERNVATAQCLIPDLCSSSFSSSSGEWTLRRGKKKTKKRNDDSSPSSISSGDLSSPESPDSPNVAVAEHYMLLQEAGLRSFKDRHAAHDATASHVAAAAPAAMYDSRSPSLADAKSLPYRKASKSKVEVSIAAIDSQDEDEDGDFGLSKEEQQARFQRLFAAHTKLLGEKKSKKQAMVTSYSLLLVDDGGMKNSTPLRSGDPRLEPSTRPLPPDYSKDEIEVGDPPIADIETLSPSRPAASRSPDRKRVASSGVQSPPKRHAGNFPDGVPALVLRPPPNGGDGDDDDREGKGGGK